MSRSVGDKIYQLVVNPGKPSFYFVFTSTCVGAKPKASA